ncbi:MAG: CoA-binding protein [Candidatus Thermoplasmatota archaeon]|nr:CoA-binding protein [Candidatus Thermoplasmatota archaeon]
MNETSVIREVFRDNKSVAVVGISNKTDRDSYKVSKYLMEHGFKVIPINPALTEWEGIKCYPDLESASLENKIEVVDIFRKSEAVVPVIEEALKIMPDVIWMQLGVENMEGAKLAEDNSIKVIMNKCIMEEHKKMNVGVA